MKHLALFLVSAMALFGCSRSGDKQQSGDMGAFIIQHAKAFGANPRTDALPSLTAEWKYELSSDFTGRKMKMTLEGDHIEALEPFLLVAFGPPMFPVITNAERSTVLGLHSSDGVAVQFLCEDAKDGKRHTKIEIQGPPKK